MKISPDQLDVLFLTDRHLWPLDQGAVLRGHHMLVALRDLGLRVAIAGPKADRDAAPASIRRDVLDWPNAPARDIQQFRAGWSGHLQRLRFSVADYMGVNPANYAGAVTLVNRHRPAAVIGLGLLAPFMLRGLTRLNDSQRPTLTWYAADELLYYQATCLRHATPGTLRRRLRETALHAALETLFVRGLDGAIGVSPLDATLLRLLAGAKKTVTIRNGVDLDYFRPAVTTRPHPRSLAFWGRLDFEPNIDAICHFTQTVWPSLTQRHPDATLTIFGKNPDPRVLALQYVPGVEVLGEVADLRPHVHAATAAILPLRSGAGIKNKLLEAAAMGKPIVASPRAVCGLDMTAATAAGLTGGGRMALVCRNEQQWVESIHAVWTDAALRSELSLNARAWACSRHSWSAAARTLTDWLGLETRGVVRRTGTDVRKAA